MFNKIVFLGIILVLSECCVAYSPPLKGTAGPITLFDYLVVPVLFIMTFLLCFILVRKNNRDEKNKRENNKKKALKKRLKEEAKKLKEDRKIKK